MNYAEYRQLVAQHPWLVSIVEKLGQKDKIIAIGRGIERPFVRGTLKSLRLMNAPLLDWNRAGSSEFSPASMVATHKYWVPFCSIPDENQQPCALSIGDLRLKETAKEVFEKQRFLRGALGAVLDVLVWYTIEMPLTSDWRISLDVYRVTQSLAPLD